MAFAPLAIDMYLPALPAIGRDLAAPPAAVQLSLSSFFLGFGIGQLVWGPLGDRFGRCGPIVAGIVLYIIGCVACALTADADHLVLWRFVQAFGACAAPVLARAMVRDLFPQDQAARMLSLMMLIMGIAPMVAPLLGGQVLVWSGWRMIFWGLAVFGLIVLAGLYTIPESLHADKRRRIGFGDMVSGYFRLLGDRAFMAYTLSGAFFTGGMFTYIAATPFVYIEYFGISPQFYGFLFGINVVGHDLQHGQPAAGAGDRVGPCAGMGRPCLRRLRPDPGGTGGDGKLRVVGDRGAAVPVSGDDGSGRSQRDGRSDVGGARHGGCRVRAGRHRSVWNGGSRQRSGRLAVGRHARSDGAGDRRHGGMLRHLGAGAAETRG